VGSVFDNARISRLSASVNRRIDDLKEVFHAELRADRAEVRANAGKLESKPDTIIGMFGHPRHAC